MNAYISKYLEANLSGSESLEVGSLVSEEYLYQLYPKTKVMRFDCFVFIKAHDHLVFGAFISIYQDAIVRLYVEKIDSVVYTTRIKGLSTQTTLSLLQYFVDLYGTLKIHIYCATSTQLIFRNSLYSSKNILSDRGLIQWWLNIASKLSPVCKYCLIPGENASSTKSIVPADFQWGIGVDLKSSAHGLPRFPDDLVTKSLKYTDIGVNVSGMLEVIDCMESSGLRALVLLDFVLGYTAPTRYIHSITMPLWCQFQSILEISEFGTEAEAKLSTVRICEHLIKLGVERLALCKLTLPSDDAIGKVFKAAAIPVLQPRQVNNIGHLIKKKRKLN